MAHRMITDREALVATMYLNAAGYLPNTEGQAEVWARTINAAVPWADVTTILAACEATCSKHLPRVNTGDVITELRRARDAEYHERSREMQLGRGRGTYTPVSRDELRVIFARHGQTITFRERESA